MNKLTMVAGAGLLGLLMAGCASTPINEKMGTWQNERPYADAIKVARESGRKLQDKDVELVFTMDDFKKELPEKATSIEPVIVLAKTALNIGAEVANTASPLYVAAVESVDNKWARYVGRDVETDAQGDIEKYLAKVPQEYRDQTRKDYEAYQKIVKYVPDVAVTNRGAAVCQRFITTNDKGEKILDITGVEALSFSSKQSDKDDYNAFVTYRDYDPVARKYYDNALKAKIVTLIAKIQLQMKDLMEAAQKLQNDPQVKQLDFMALATTIKGVGVGIGKVFADPLGKLNGALNGYSLSEEVDEIVEATQNVEKGEAENQKKD